MTVKSHDKLVGLTVTHVIKYDRESLTLVFNSTHLEKTYGWDEEESLCNAVTLTHHQDCCESVWLEDICGDLEDFIDAKILTFEEISETMPTAYESGTWTFYRIQTTKGEVVLRWCGESNGYYSERVDVDWTYVDVDNLEKGVHEH